MGFPFPLSDRPKSWLIKSRNPSTYLYPSYVCQQYHQEPVMSHVTTEVHISPNRVDTIGVTTNIVERRSRYFELCLSLSQRYRNEKSNRSRFKNGILVLLILYAYGLLRFVLTWFVVFSRVVDLPYTFRNGLYTNTRPRINTVFVRPKTPKVFLPSPFQGTRLGPYNVDVYGFQSVSLR